MTVAAPFVRRPSPRSPASLLRRRSLSLRIADSLLFVWMLLTGIAPDMTNFVVRWRPEDVVLLVLAGIAFWRMLTGRVRLSPVFYWLAFLAGALTVVSALGMVFGDGEAPAAGTFGGSPIVEAAKEAVRYAKYLLVAFVFSSVSSRTWQRAFKGLVLACLILIGIQWLQFLGFGVINTWIGTYYQEDFKYWNYDYAKAIGQWRSGSLMLNPNVLAGYLVLPLMLTLARYVRPATTKRERAARWRWGALIALIVSGIFMTQGRTVLLAGVLGAGTAISYLAIIGRVRMSRIAGMAVLILIAGAGLALTFGDAVYRFTPKGLAAGFGKESMSVKGELALAAVRALDGVELLVGEGAGQSPMVDSEIAYTLCWYGVIGLGAYFVFYLGLMRTAIRRVDEPYLRAAFLGVMITYLVGAAASSFLLNMRVFPAFLAMLSIATAQSAARAPRARAVRRQQPCSNPTSPAPLDSNA